MRIFYANITVGAYTYLCLQIYCNFDPEQNVSNASLKGPQINDIHAQGD